VYTVSGESRSDSTSHIPTPRNAGYLGAYDVGTGAFVGAVVGFPYFEPVPSAHDTVQARTLGGSGIFSQLSCGSIRERNSNLSRSSFQERNYFRLPRRCGVQQRLRGRRSRFPPVRQWESYMSLAYLSLARILSPVDPAAGYISLTFGNPNCAAGFFTNNQAWAPIAAADGFPRALSDCYPPYIYLSGHM
jgi:hypothetical protein